MRFALLMLALVSSGAPAPAVRDAPRAIRVVVDNAYAPYSFRSDKDELQGILIDQWRAWERQTGIAVDIEAMDWVEALQRTRAGEFDVIDSIFETAARREFFDFSSAYTLVEASIFFRNDISGITDVQSLKGFPVGVKAGDQHIEQLKANGVTTVVEFRRNDEIVEAAAQRKISVFVMDDPSAFYFLNKMGIASDFRHSAPVFRDELRRAVRKGEMNLLRTVSQGFAAIEPGALRRIDEKWFGSTIGGYGRYLTDAGYAAAALILIVAGLAAWNRTLRKRVLERTAAVSESEQRFRRLEAHLRLVIDTIPTMAWSLLPKGGLDFVNQRWLDYTGLSLAKALVGDSIRIVHPEDLSRAVDKWNMAMAAGKPYEHEMRLRRADGEYRWFLVRVVPLRDEQGTLVKWYGTSTDIEDRKRAEDSRRQMSRSLVDVQESERRQLARELHDRVGQNLTALKINIDTLAPELASQGNDAVRARLADSSALLEATMDTIENVLSELRPPMLDDHGLAAALDWHARNFSRRTKIAVSVRCSERAVRPAPEVAIALFRIAQEALNNVAKHARAQRVDITLDRADGECVMSVQDDGIGFKGAEIAPDKPTAGFGMVTMRERSQAIGGRFEVRALPGRGTKLTVRAPY
jgi:PAS domain S-box-containing protein